MNVQALDKLINDVRNCDPAKFDMRHHQTCMLSFISSSMWKGATAREASEVLGISYEDARSLFINVSLTANKKMTLEDITKDEAVVVLEHLKATGKVDWSVARD
jgi:hypothetical protein